MDSELKLLEEQTRIMRIVRVQMETLSKSFEHIPQGSLEQAERRGEMMGIMWVIDVMGLGQDSKLKPKK